MPLRIGHRGAAGTHPENTIASFRHAVALGVDGIEFDIHRTADGQLVVIHDALLDRTTSGTGLVMSHTLAAIEQLDAGLWKGEQFRGERVPSLKQLIRQTPHALKLFIELKAGSIRYPGIEAELIQTIRAEGAEQRVQISSFDHQALRLIHQQAPAWPLGMLYAENLLDPIGMAQAIGAQALHPAWEWVTPELVQHVHSHGLAVHTWTVNLPMVIDHIKQCGVDGIMSDFPDRI